jgi:hypothetical protein
MNPLHSSYYTEHVADDNVGKWIGSGVTRGLGIVIRQGNVEFMLPVSLDCS